MSRCSYLLLNHIWGHISLQSVQHPIRDLPQRTYRFLQFVCFAFCVLLLFLLRQLVCTQLPCLVYDWCSGGLSLMCGLEFRRGGAYSAMLMASITTLVVGFVYHYVIRVCFLLFLLSLPLQSPASRNCLLQDLLLYVCLYIVVLVYNPILLPLLLVNFLFLGFEEPSLFENATLHPLFIHVLFLLL